MGNICSVSISVDHLIPSCWECGTRHANYLQNLSQNLDALKSACGRMKGLRNDVKRKVDIAEREELQALDQVQGWLSKVDNMETEVNQLIADGTKELAVKNCPRSCTSRYKLGKRVASMSEQVDALINQAPSDPVAERRLPSPRAGERPTEATVGMDSRLHKVLRRLDDEHVGIIGLYGLGGVGKTTLLTHMNNAFAKTTTTAAHDFDFVIWSTVSKNVNHENIQDDIWKKIGFVDDKWRSKSRDEKAMSILRVLKGKRFLLLLDDLWEQLNLSDLGVPSKDKRNHKIVFTTRSEEVCGQMGIDKKIKVECLTGTESWDLFRMKLGEDTLNSHPDIPELAADVVQECCGLPLVLTTMGRAMACKKSPYEWRYAIKVLRSSASKFPGMGDRVFPLLKYSYDCLPTQAARSCFLYCSLYREDYKIQKSDLIDRWICEGFLDEFDEMEGAQNLGHNIIGTLIHAGLLEETEFDDMVKLHDVIRDMALWIACETGGVEVQDKFLVQAGCGLMEAPEVGRWMVSKRISLMHNKIEGLKGSPNCPNLSTLFLQGNTLKTIADSFFQCMPNLRVLDLSETSITELPRGISNLVSLQYLNLSITNIKELPMELKNLGKLKCLKLRSTPELSSIPKQLISSLSTLQVLDMSGSGIPSDGRVLKDGLLCDDNESLVEELESLKYLHELGATVTSVSALQRLLSSHKLRSHTCTLWLHNFKGSSSLNIASLGNVKPLLQLSFVNCGSLEDLEIDWDGNGNEKEIIESNIYLNSKNKLNNCFQGLVCVYIVNCSRLKDLTWLVFAPNLAELLIIGCEQMEEVIGSSKCGEFAGINGQNVSPFARLQMLTIINLPQLKSIYWRPLPFIYLNGIRIYGCPLLKKLPLNTDSAKEKRIAIAGQNKWYEELEWEDESTRNAFLPFFQPVGE